MQPKKGETQQVFKKWLLFTLKKCSRTHGESRHVSGLGLDAARDLLSNWEHEEDRAKLLHEVQTLRAKDSVTSHQLTAAKAANMELSVELENVQAERVQLMEEVNELLSIQAQVFCPIGRSHWSMICTDVFPNHQSCELTCRVRVAVVAALMLCLPESCLQMSVHYFPEICCGKHRQHLLLTWKAKLNFCEQVMRNGVTELHHSSSS